MTATSSARAKARRESKRQSQTREAMVRRRSFGGREEGKQRDAVEEEVWFIGPCRSRVWDFCKDGENQRRFS